MNRLETKHGYELPAGVVMRAALGGSLVQNDDQSRPAMYDLVVNYRDGRRAAEEVVSTRDHDALRLEAETRKMGHVPGLRSPRCG
jgi:hypothetical protein